LKIGRSIVVRIIIDVVDVILTPVPAAHTRTPRQKSIRY
jgi:hypothetical protein